MIANRDELLALAEFVRSMPEDKRCGRIADILESFAGPTPPPVFVELKPWRAVIVDGVEGAIELDDPRVVGPVCRQLRDGI